MRIAVARETTPGETRVALTPKVVRRLVDGGHEVRVETEAGLEASFDDGAYREAGAEIAADPASLLEDAGCALKVRPPRRRDGGLDEVDALAPGSLLVGLLDPHGETDTLRRLAEGGITSLSLELLPRITRAQSMDALSSMSTVAGYKATLLAADSLIKFFPMLTTAAGTISPARVLVLGAGVAGLQAIATARRLGAQVEAFDIRPAVKEQVASLGATFLEWEEALGEEAETEEGYAAEVDEETEERERELVARHAARADVIVTTALIPGREAPKLVTREMVASMERGSVIVDLAAPAGGNCEVSRPGESVEHEGVLVHAPLNLPATIPFHASQMYARNLSSLLDHLAPEGTAELDLEDEILEAICVTHDGTVRFSP
ncbi:MAG: Re/Si-specific NAD(P)(+) transhydrogenase subunit alpha [Gemmatimonadota bacterium]